MTVLQLRALCVDGFPASKIRGEIMAGFEAIHQQAVNVGITGEVWVDGSFLTKKMEPGDVDFILVTESHYLDSGTEAQKEFIEWLISSEDEPKKCFLCHTDVVLLYPPDSFWHEQGLKSLKHWEENVYGFSVSTKEPKGIAVVELMKPKEVKQ